MSAWQKAIKIVSLALCPLASRPTSIHSVYIVSIKYWPWTTINLVIVLSYCLPTVLTKLLFIKSSLRLHDFKNCFFVPKPKN